MGPASTAPPRQECPPFWPETPGAHLCLSRPQIAHTTPARIGPRFFVYFPSLKSVQAASHKTNKEQCPLTVARFPIVSAPPPPPPTSPSPPLTPRPQVRRRNGRVVPAATSQSATGAPASRTALAWLPALARTRFPVNLSIRQEVPRHLDGFGDGGRRHTKHRGRGRLEVVEVSRSPPRRDRQGGGDVRLPQCVELENVRVGKGRKRNNQALIPSQPCWLSR